MKKELNAMKMLLKKAQLQMQGTGDDEHDEDEYATGIAVDVRSEVKKPNLYRVLLLNDDYTPMDFVVFVLEKFFRKTREEATAIMLNVHRSGVGECGVYTYEVAESKVSQVMASAMENQHPLQCVMEKK